MNTKNLLLGILVASTIVLALLTFTEYSKINMLNSQLLQSQSKSNVTQTSTSTTTTTTTIATSTVTTTTTAFLLNTTYGSFTYDPNNQVKVDSVRAILEEPMTLSDRNGTRNVRFAVTFENIGKSPIYVLEGWCGQLSVSVASNNSSVLKKFSTLVCSCASMVISLNQGQNYTIYGPDCGVGHSYRFVQAGTVNVNLGFRWTTDSKAAVPFSNLTEVSAKFIFA